MHKPQLSGATAARPPLPLYDLLSPRPSTCRVSNSPYGSAPGPQEYADPCSGLRAFDTGHLPLQRLCMSRPAGYEPRIAVSYSPIPDGSKDARKGFVSHFGLLPSYVLSAAHRPCH